ncbi:MAG TPA: aromatic ring-hydroxylating dioxygenase subunit alpha [Candidatus Tumulicola sp.]
MTERQSEATAAGLERSLPRRAYVETAYFERERRNIFWSQWFCIGRTARFQEAGTYEAIDVAGEAAIVVRSSAGLRAHLNLCRHRGSRLLCGSGTLRGAIRCPYHGWAYDPDGRLISAPFVDDEALPSEVRRLHPVEIDSWGGFAFVRVAREGQPTPLLEQLGDAPQRVANYRLDRLRVGRTMQYDVRANWKVILENYNECYHCAGVHPELCRIVPAFKRRGGSELDWERGIEHRPGAWTFSFDGTSDRRPFAQLNDDERTRHKGELLYPNFMLSLSADHAAAFTLWPQSPERTVIVCDLLFDPAEMERSNFDPGDAAAFWDLVNRQDWAVCEGVQAGMQSRAFRYGYYAPMEDYSLDIRRYVERHLGPQAVAIEEEDVRP